MEQTHPFTDHTGAAREDRARMLHAIRDLEQELASASFSRENAWGMRINESLVALQKALRETRELADAKGGLFEELVQDFPRLQGKAERLRKNYDALQEHIEKVRSALCAQPILSSDEVSAVREQLAQLLAKVRQTQAVETELLFEAYQVDIGIGD